MYKYHYEGLTVFGGIHIWNILDSEGFIICQVCNISGELTQVNNLLAIMNKQN